MIVVDPCMAAAMTGTHQRGTSGDQTAEVRIIVKSASKKLQQTTFSILSFAIFKKPYKALNLHVNRLPAISNVLCNNVKHWQQTTLSILSFFKKSNKA